MSGHDTSNDGASAFAFGPFVFDLEAGELRRDGVVVPLQRQPARALAFLLARAPLFVARAELEARIWGGDVHVDYRLGLNYCIRQIRIALGERASTPIYLETVARGGYRLKAPVERLEQTPLVNGSAAVAALDCRRSPAVDTIARKPAISLVRSPVPLWLAAAFVIATAIGSVRLSPTYGPFDMAPHAEVVRISATPSHLKLALDALHALSHAVVDGSRADSARAWHTLWVVTASHVGLASESDLFR